MAQHDYVIDNQTAPNFRADLNNALAAIVSTNSGSSAPSTTYANMMWYDTTANILKMRNEADDTWINLGTLDQVANTFAANILLASQAEAEAGTENTKAMTPLRTAQAIAFQVNSGKQFIASIDASNDATIDFTGFDATKFDAYEFVLSNVVPATDGVGLILRTSTDGGSNYDAGASDYRSNYTIVAATGGGADNTTASSIALTTSNVGSSAGEDGVSGSLIVTGAHLTKKTTVTGQFGSWRNDGVFFGSTIYGARDSSADVDAIRFLFTSGNVESGTITMYGLSNS